MFNQIPALAVTLQRVLPYVTVLLTYVSNLPTKSPIAPLLNTLPPRLGREI